MNGRAVADTLGLRPAIVALLSGIAAALGGGNDGEGGTELETLREEVQVLKARMADLQADTADEKTPQDQSEEDEGFSLTEFLGQVDIGDHTDIYGSLESVITIHGFLNFRYLDVENGTSTFDLTHANMFFAADLSASMQAWVEIEYEHASETIELDQAELRLIGKPGTIAFGRFYAPFGIERKTWYPPNKVLISRPDAFRQVVPGNWYETGVRGAHAREIGDWKTGIEIALSNGLGEDAATDVRNARQFRDNNDSKAVIGRVGVEPSEVLAAGVSFATMNYDDRNAIDFLGADVEFSPDGWLLRAEAVQSGVESVAGDFDREGGYLLLARKVYDSERNAVWIAGRFDVLDGNDTMVDALDYSAFTLGATWFRGPNLGFRVEGRQLDGRHGSNLPGETIFAVSVVLDY